MKGGRLHNPRSLGQFIKHKPRFLRSPCGGDCSASPGPFPSGSGCAIFDQSPFQSGNLLMSQSQFSLHCLLRIVFLFQQGTARTKRKSYWGADRLSSYWFFFHRSDREVSWPYSSSLGSSCPPRKSRCPVEIGACTSVSAC